MKTIVQIVQHMATGGIEVMALEMLRLKREDTRVFIVSLEGEKSTAIEQWPRLTPFANDLFFLNKQPGIRADIVFKLAKQLKQLNADAIHSHHIGPLIYGGLAAKFTGIHKHVHTEHDAWHLANKKRRRLESIALKAFQPILVADSKTVAQAMKHYLPGIEPHVILNGVDTDTFKPGNKKDARAALALPQGVTLIGSAGRLEKEKGHTTLISAMNYLPDNVHVAIAGSGSLLDALMEQVKTNQLEGRVHFVGHQNNMAQFYHSLDAFCLPSINEGMPLVPLEAQACNIPTVMSRVGACDETICPASGKLVEPGDAIDLAFALHSATQQQATLTPREFVIENADATNMTNAYAEFCLNQEVF